MKLYEYQGKELFRQYGLPTPKGVVVKSLDNLEEQLQSLGFPVVVKSQVLTGGRGKAGGVLFADNVAEVRAAGSKLLGSVLKDCTVDALLVEEKVAVVEEYYLSITVDRASRMPLVMFSRSGGMDIEEVAKTRPEAIAKVTVDPQMGVRGFHCEMLAKVGGVTDPGIKKELAKVVKTLYNLYYQKDATLVEVNPLMLLTDGTLIAADAKVDIDDSAVYRHADIRAMEEAVPVAPLVKEARDTGFLYIDVDETGTVGVISNGSGMIMSCIDWIARQGGQVTCALDLGGGATADRVAEGIKIVLKNSRVKSLLISIFGGITRCDEIAGGVLKAVTENDFGVPIVTRLEGTNKEKGLQILSEADSKKIIVAASLPEAADKVLKAQQ
ncbi:MAG: ADP-forming succinate--CoA ligase subunit beta [Firmicutes bacterium]|nr:ADP-forming succinate--CoA ligase subunit beta [Bacillota bacterium]